MDLIKKRGLVKSMNKKTVSEFHIGGGKFLSASSMTNKD